jgi:hypothetical protein
VMADQEDGKERSESEHENEEEDERKMPASIPKEVRVSRTMSGSEQQIEQEDVEQEDVEQEDVEPEDAEPEDAEPEEAASVATDVLIKRLGKEGV